MRGRREGGRRSGASWGRREVRWVGREMRSEREGSDERKGGYEGGIEREGGVVRVGDGARREGVGRECSGREEERNGVGRKGGR